MQDNEIRLNKYIATNYGISRREADDLIDLGKVFVNGEKAGIGARIKMGDTVTVNGHDIVTQDLIYLALHKPLGYVCSRKAQGDAPTIYDLTKEIPEFKKRWTPR
jgi:23S rRNA pseudouridine2604 synthase